MPMNEDLYGDGEAPRPPKPDDQEDAGQKEEQETSGETALVPISLCPGMKPGDEMVVHIDKVLDDQYQISYAPEPKHEGEGEEGEEGGGPPPKPPGGMSSMGENYD